MSRIVLNLIRSEIGSQCRSNKTGVMRSNEGNLLQDCHVITVYMQSEQRFKISLLF